MDSTNFDTFRKYHLTSARSKYAHEYCTDSDGPQPQEVLKALPGHSFLRIPAFGHYYWFWETLKGYDAFVDKYFEEITDDEDN